MRIKVRVWISRVLIIFGILMLTFPFLAKKVGTLQINGNIKNYIGVVNNLKKESNELDELYRLMKEYNKDLNENGQDIIDAFSYQDKSFDLTEYGFEENIIGIIQIPKIDVKLPIYLGATEENLYKGAVHLSKTSLPLGEKNSNVVIAAHRGLIRNPMFKEIDKLVKGDEVIITTPWETLTYTVCELKIISPMDSSEILIQKNRDMVTLITCHPYRVNNKRYVVYCER